MLTFSPTEEQEEICQLAQSLAIEQFRQQARRSEKDGDISLALAQTLAQTGLTTPFSEDHGGQGTIEAVTYALIAEELSFGDSALAMNVLGSLIAPVTVVLAGNASQQLALLPAFSDEKTGHMLRGSLAFAERTGGYALADITATARKDGDNYILNGTKRNVIHAGQAVLRIAIFRLEGTNDLDSFSAFVLPEQTRGMRISDDVQKLGLIAAPSASYSFENVVVPASCLLGEPGNDGVKRTLALYEILRAGVACGMARASLEHARDYASGRIAFGRPIASYQGIAFLIAEIAMKLDAARLLVWHSAINWDHNADIPFLVRDAEAAQKQALKIAKSATIDAIQVLGGAGYLQDHPVEMWARNAAAME
ncbi:MAG: acyl-CoA dehydrogenase family protein [Ktedonobacteraceae bacterium]